MEDFRNNLIEAKEITKRCRNREEIKRHLVSLSLIGIILLTLEFHQQRSSYLGLPIDSDKYKETMNAISNYFSKKTIKPPINVPPKIKTIIKPNEEIIASNTTTDEIPIGINNHEISYSFEFACVLSAI